MNWDDILNEQEHLEHWGILGMKWGVRRYQNKDGSLTSAGRARYGSGSKTKPQKTDAQIRDEIYRNPKPSDLKKYKHLFTTQELKDISEREKAIASVISSDKIISEKNLSTAKRFGGYTNTTANLLKDTAVIVSAALVGKKIIDTLRAKNTKYEDVKKYLKDL